MKNHIFIPSKGRPECVTARYLADIGYPGGWTILLGDDDDSIEEYVDNFGEEHIIVFDKRAAVDNTDMMDAYADSRPSGVAPARNEVARQARMMGLERCWMLDDDYDGIMKYGKDPLDKHIISDGHELFDELEVIESFGERTQLPVVGFDTTGWKRRVPFYSKYVFNGFNMDVREGHFVPFRGRLFEDAVHTMQMANMGKSDMCFRHLECHDIAGSYAWNTADTKEVKGGLNDLYGEYSGGWDKRDVVRLTNCQFTVMANPTYYRIIFRPDKFYWECNLSVHVMIVSDKWARY